MRYKGQEVGRIKEKDDDTYLQISKTTAKNEEYFGDPEKNSAAIIGTPIETKWDGNRRKLFKYFKIMIKKRCIIRSTCLKANFDRNLKK